MEAHARSTQDRSSSRGEEVTDAHLPGRWLNDPTLDILGDQAWRIHTNALMWSNEQGTDGFIPRRTLRLLHVLGVQLAAVEELTQAKLWAKAGSDYQILDWAKSQSLAVDVDWQRERNRTNQKALRERERDKSKARRPTSTFDGAVSGDVLGDVREDAVVQDSQVQAKYLEASENSISESVNQQTGEVFELGSRFEFVHENGKTRRVKVPA